jgi:hypothetical protein
VGARLPLWVGRSEKEEIDSRLDGFVAALEGVGADLTGLASTLTKPLRAMWVSQHTVRHLAHPSVLSTHYHKARLCMGAVLWSSAQRGQGL